MSKQKQQPSEEKKAKKPGIIQSETVIIQRSQIHFAPYNPKRHTDEAVKKQLKNFKDRGFFGGVLWNKTTGNLVSGHKRIMALDLHYGYDGTPEKDYQVKVEQTELDSKAEREQNIYMDARSTNTPQELDLLAAMLPELDYKAAGLTADDLNLISVEIPTIDFTPTDTIKQDFKQVAQSQEQKKEQMKQLKEQIKNNVSENQGETYVTLSFDSYANKCEFMERFGFDVNLRFIKGEGFSDMIERID